MSVILPQTSPQLLKVGKTEEPDPTLQKRKSPNQHRYSEVRSCKHLLPQEVDAMMKAIRKHGGRHVHRDSTLILLLYRHGLRVSEAAAPHWEQVDFAAATLHVNRLKNGSSASHPLYGDELRALRQLRRDYPNSPFLFMSCRRLPKGQCAPRNRPLPLTLSEASSNKQENWQISPSLSMPICCGTGAVTTS